jgi:hypothetical protein
MDQMAAEEWIKQQAWKSVTSGRKVKEARRSDKWKQG